MKSKRHHNNQGIRQIVRGRTRRQAMVLARRLKLKYKYSHRVNKEGNLERTVINDQLG